MKTGRLEAFSDGVLAIIITIMVLGMSAPEDYTFEALKPILPVFLTYHTELYIYRYLLEQPSPFAASCKQSKWQNIVGKPKFIVLALTFSICNGLDGQKLF